MGRKAFAATITLVSGVACKEAPKPEAAAPVVTAPTVVDVIATEFAFASPDTVSAGWVTVRLHSDGQELHHASLGRLEEGKTMADLATLGPTDPIPAWFVAVGGPNPPRPGGGVAEATVHLAPGNYVMFCAIPSADGVMHMMKGMAKPLVVVAAAGPESEPDADVVLTLKDYAFNLSTPLTAGHHVIKVVVEANQPHEVLFAKLEPGKTAGDLASWSEKQVGPPPGVPLGGVAGLSPGRVNYVAVDLEPGNYAMICFIPDAKDGKPHFMLGMMTEFKVM